MSCERTTLRRHPERARADALHALLDEALVAHVATATDHGPLVLPMAFGRIGDTLYLHGAVANGLLRAAEGTPICVTVTQVDGLVLAKSAFRHSMNYRSAVIFGTPRLVEDERERREALEAVVDHALPGRSSEARPPSARELRTTRVVALDLDEASVKVRSGPPNEAESDRRRPTWSGVLPLRQAADAPRPTEDAPPSLALRAAVLARAPRLAGRAAGPGFVVDPDPRRLDLDRVLGWIRDESYWGGTLTAPSLLRSLAGAYVVGAYDDDGGQIAVARVVTDEVSVAWLGDVFVDRAHRDRGVGLALIRFLVEHPRFTGVRKWILGTADAHALYRRLGFEDAPPGRYMLRRGGGQGLAG